MNCFDFITKIFKRAVAAAGVAVKASVITPRVAVTTGEKYRNQSELLQRKIYTTNQGQGKKKFNQELIWLQEN